MASNKTITVNGRSYDAVTGLPVEESTKSATPAPQKAAPTPVKTTARAAASSVHTSTERSKTLRRSAVKKPAASKPAHPTRGRSMDIARNPNVKKFATHPAAAKQTAKPVASVAAKPAAKKVDTPDRAPQTHPMAAKAIAKQKATEVKPAKKLTSKEKKEQAITAALKSTPKPAKKKRSLSIWKKRVIIGAIVLIAMGGAAYGVYRFVPSVSVSVAAAQAGVDATYPEYIPDGFSLHHPVTYSDGQVMLSFVSNSNDDTYSITQTRSSWDSSALLDNVVAPAVGDNYLTTKERGLTIYTYDNHASWMNGGVMYTITYDAHLSTEQIRRIATSL